MTQKTKLKKLFDDLQERVTTGGGATGTSQGPESTTKKAQAPGNSKTQGDLATKKLEGDMEETSPENNIKPTGDMSAKNKATVNMKEDLDAMFEGQELTEEFKEKATVIFETAVNVRVEEEKAALIEQYDQSFEQAKDEIQQEISEKLDEYLDYVVEQWMSANEVAVENSLRAEIAEEFIGGLKTLFVEHNIDIPDEKVDVVEELAAKVEELEARLNETINENIELRKVSVEVEKEEVFAEVAEGLAQTQIEKLRTLAEGVEFDDVETFQKKLEIVKENYFPSDKKVSKVVSEEAEELNEEVQRPVTGPMSRYVTAISRTVKN